MGNIADRHFSTSGIWLIAIFGLNVLAGGAVSSRTSYADNMSAAYADLATVVAFLVWGIAVRNLRRPAEIRPTWRLVARILSTGIAIGWAPFVAVPLVLLFVNPDLYRSYTDALPILRGPHAGQTWRLLVADWSALLAEALMPGVLATALRPAKQAK